MPGVTRVYNRKVPVGLPEKRMLLRTTPNLPLVVDLRAFCGPIKDQGAEGSCTAHAGTSANEWIHRKYLKNTTIVFSPQYTYAKELILQGDFPKDTGSDGTTLCNTLITSGCCSINAYPYIAGQINQPTVAQDQDAVQYRLGAYHGLAGSQVALSVLGDSTPWPIEIGFTVYDSFESSTGDSYIYNPFPGESQLGGHETLIVGYDIGDLPTLRPKNCPPAVLIQNSWSSAWGENGYFWMTLHVLDAGDTDLKIVHSGRPW